MLRRAGPTTGGRRSPRTAAGSKAIERGQLTLDSAPPRLPWDGEPVKLTVTEFLLLQALAPRPGFVKSRDSLMDAAYDDQVYVDDRTIDSHIKRMRKKFQAVDDDDFDTIETLYGVGYRFKELYPGGRGPRSSPAKGDSAAEHKFPRPLTLGFPLARELKRNLQFCGADFRGNDPAGLNDVLDPTTHIASQTAAEPAAGETPRAERSRSSGVRRVVRSAWAFFVAQSFSSLTRRIVFLNLTGLVALVIGVLYLTQFRAGLIDAPSAEPAGAGRDHRRRHRRLRHSGNHFHHHRSRAAARIAGRRKLRALGRSALWHRISHLTQRVAPVLRRLVSPTKTRARAHLRPGRRAHP